MQIVDAVFFVSILVAIIDYAPRLLLDGASFYWVGDVTVFNLSLTVAWIAFTAVQTHITMPRLKVEGNEMSPGWEDEALRAMAQAFLRLKIVVEPGGAASLAAALFHGDEIESDTIIAVATGGNVDPEVFQRALATLQL